MIWVLHHIVYWVSTCVYVAFVNYLGWIKEVWGNWRLGPTISFSWFQFSIFYHLPIFNMVLRFNYKFLSSFINRIIYNLVFICLFIEILIFWKSCTSRKQSSLITFTALPLHLNVLLPITSCIWRACWSSCLFLKYKIVFLEIYNLVIILKVFSRRWGLTFFLNWLSHVYIIFYDTLIIVIWIISENGNILVQCRNIALVYSINSFKIIYFI